MKFFSQIAMFSLLALCSSCFSVAEHRSGSKTKSPVNLKPLLKAQLSLNSLGKSPQTKTAHSQISSSIRMQKNTGLNKALAEQTVSLELVDESLASVLQQLAQSAGFQLVCDVAAIREHRLNLRVEEQPLGKLLQDLSDSFGFSMMADGSVVSISSATEGDHLERWPLLIYPLRGGLVSSEEVVDFSSLQQLSFISQSQKSSAKPATPAASSSRKKVELSRLELFLKSVPDLMHWPKGSSWHLDRSQNLLLVRSQSATLDRLEKCLDLLTASPPRVMIEARFVEVSETRTHELGVQLGLLNDYALKVSPGQIQAVVDGASSTRFGLTPVQGAATGSATPGLSLAVLGVGIMPQFDVLLNALEESGDGHVLSAPAIVTVNNARATIAITTNLPYVEDYRPVIDRNIVASEGISRSDTSVALVAQINDENFTGIVLNVTPSMGNENGEIVLRVQPVVRDKIGEIEIFGSALVEGVATPAIARPIIETRFLDTHLSIRSGETIVLGGMKNTVERRGLSQVPVLGSLPLIGALFRRESRYLERRDLLIFISATLVESRR